MNVACFLLGNSTASEFYCILVKKTYGDGTGCSKTSAFSPDLRIWNRVFQNIGIFTRPMKMEQGVPKVGVFTRHTSMEQGVPKRRRIKFKPRVIAQKIGYNKREDGGRNFWARSGYK